VGGTDERGGHAFGRIGRWNVARPRDLERGFDANGAIEVEVELRLRHRRREPAQGGSVHDPMLRCPP
jgi:hypothetical protein